MMTLLLEGADNARDFGGTVNCRGQKIRPGLLIRSNHLNALTPTDIKLLHETYHLKKIIDLRTQSEAASWPDAEIPGASRVHLPLFSESAIGITHEAAKSKDPLAGVETMPDMPSLYQRIVREDDSVSQLRLVFQEILAEQNGAVLWHCTEGKDRCGIVSALTLSLLDVDRNTIFEDYLATNLASQKRARAYSDQILERTGNELLAQTVRNIFLAVPSYLQAVFDFLDREYGSVTRFFDERLGISPEQTRQFQERCLQ